MERFRGGLVSKAHRRLYHSTPGLRVRKKEKKKNGGKETKKLQCDLGRGGAGTLLDGKITTGATAGFLSYTKFSDVACILDKKAPRSEPCPTSCCSVTLGVVGRGVRRGEGALQRGSVTGGLFLMGEVAL